jgi:hypothetical protein
MVKSNIPSSLPDIDQSWDITPGTVEAGKNVVAADTTKDVGTLGTVSMEGATFTQEAITATADGTGTGTIADGPLFRYIAVTASNAAHIVVLPTPTPGTTIIGYVGANGFELRSDTPASVAIAGGSGASAESAIPANTLFMIVCTSATTWLGWDLTGTTFASIEAAA